MKKILFGLLTLTTLTSAFAGSIYNRSTGENLRFSFEAKERTVYVESTSRLLENKRVNLSQIKRWNSRVNLVGVSQGICDEVWGGESPIAMCYLVPFANIPGVAGLTVDVLAMPIKAPLKVIQNAKYKRDIKLLLNAITKDQDIEVTNARFLRISKLL
jgi:hypothetical protein